MQQRYYDPVAGRFLSVDPVTTDAKTGDSFNRYVYGRNNPYKFKDPDGRFAETLWDIASLALSVNEFRSNPSIGNAIGVAVDAAAVVIPGIPGGVGAIRQAGKAAEGATTAARVGEKTAAATRADNVAKGIPESQLGPSGKPKIHVVDHGGQRKEAKDAARAEVGKGGTTENHTTPAVGKDHYHGVTQSGEKSRVHHEYDK